MDNGRSHTQEEWAEFRRREGFGPADLPLLTAYAIALRDNEGKEGVEELRELLAGDFRRGVMTGTRVTYGAKEPDLIRHGVGMPEERTLEAQLVGHEGYLGGMGGLITGVLFGNSDESKIRDAYTWVIGEVPYLSLRNNRPKKDVERALLLGYGFVIVAGGVVGIGDVRPARGVRIAPQNSTGSKG